MSSRRTQEEDGPPMNLNQLEVSLMPVTCLMKNTPHIHCRKNEGKCASFYPKISGVCPEPVLANRRNVESAFGRYCGPVVSQVARTDAQRMRWKSIAKARPAVVDLRASLRATISYCT